MTNSSELRIGYKVDKLKANCLTVVNDRALLTRSVEEEALQLSTFSHITIEIELRVAINKTDFITNRDSANFIVVVDTVTRKTDLSFPLENRQPPISWIKYTILE